MLYLTSPFRGDESWFNFEDERLLDFTVDDFNTLYEAFLELYGERRVFFLDEIQNIQLLKET